MKSREETWVDVEAILIHLISHTQKTNSGADNTLTAM